MAAPRNRNANARPRRKRRVFHRRKVCRFCADSTIVIDYKDPKTLRHFITERGKIIPRRISGTCARAPAGSDHRDQTGAHHRPAALRRQPWSNLSWPPPLPVAAAGFHHDPRHRHRDRLDPAGLCYRGAGSGTGLLRCPVHAPADPFLPRQTRPAAGRGRTGDRDGGHVRRSRCIFGGLVLFHGPAFVGVYSWANCLNGTWPSSRWC